MEKVKDEHHTVEGLPWDDPVVPKYEQIVIIVNWVTIVGLLLMMALGFYLVARVCS